MHKTESDGHVNNKFSNGAPGVPSTRWAADDGNAHQEELCNTIEEAGIQLKTKATDTYDQLKEAIKILARHGVIQTTGGTSTAYTFSVIPAITGYTDGMWWIVKFHTDSGVSPTLNINGVGAKPIRLADDAQPDVAAEIKGGSVVKVIYDSTDDCFRIIGMTNAKEIDDARGSKASINDRIKGIVKDDGTTQLRNDNNTALNSYYKGANPFITAWYSVKNFVSGPTQVEGAGLAAIASTTVGTGHYRFFLGPQSNGNYHLYVVAVMTYDKDLKYEIYNMQQGSFEIRFYNGSGVAVDVEDFGWMCIAPQYNLT